MDSFKSSAFYKLDPHVTEYDAVSRLIPIDVLATEAYGKSFDSLRACQRNNENLGNDQVVEYCFEDDSYYEEALADFDDPTVYLGYDAREGKSVTIEGITEIEYWKSITWLNADSPIDNTISPEDVAQLERFMSNGAEALTANPYIGDRWARYQAGELIVVEVNPPEHKNLTNAVFKDEFFAQRAFSPGLGSVIADLIRREVLPRGNSIYNHWW